MGIIEWSIPHFRSFPREICYPFNCKGLTESATGCGDKLPPEQSTECKIIQVTRLSSFLYTTTNKAHLSNELLYVCAELLDFSLALSSSLSSLEDSVDLKMKRIHLRSTNNISQSFNIKFSCELSSTIPSGWWTEHSI